MQVHSRTVKLASLSLQMIVFANIRIFYSVFLLLLFTWLRFDADVYHVLQQVDSSVENNLSYNSTDFHRRLGAFSHYNNNYYIV